MSAKQTLLNIQKYETKYKNIEKQSLSFSIKPKDKYLCFRLDGINVSKKYLKDKINNPVFEDIFIKSVRSVYALMYKKSPTDAQNIFLCIFLSSDEVSFILNKSPNYYDDRIFKIGSTLSGLLSSAITSFFYKKELKTTKYKNNTEIIAFDSRPIILDNMMEVEEYLKYRRQVYMRMSMSKTLRLKSSLSDKDIFKPEHKNDVKWLSENINKFSLNPTYQQLLNKSKLFIPSLKHNKLNTYTIKNKHIDIDIDIDGHFNKIHEFERELNKKNNFI